MFERIFVPLDGSKAAEGVLPFVVAEAEFHGAAVVLFRAIAPLRQSLMASPRAIENAYNQIEQIAQDYLEKVSAELESSQITVETMVKKGAPALKIIEGATAKECDLIIIGTHGETGSAQWRFGGIANKVVKAETSIPILIIPTRSQ